MSADNGLAAEFHQAGATGDAIVARGDLVGPGGEISLRNSKPDPEALAGAFLAGTE